MPYVASYLWVETKSIQLHSRTALLVADSHLLQTPHTKTVIGSHTFRSAAQKVWNSFPIDIRSAPSLLTFRPKLKTFYIRLAFQCLTFIFFNKFKVIIKWHCKNKSDKLINSNLCARYFTSQMQQDFLHLITMNYFLCTRSRMISMNAQNHPHSLPQSRFTQYTKKIELKKSSFLTFEIASATCVFPLPVGATTMQLCPSIAFRANSSWYERIVNSSGWTGLPPPEIKIANWYFKSVVRIIK